jgi:hypothetical protein
MPRHSRSHRRHRRHRSISGGNSAYSSATTYGSYVNGSADAQWNRTMDTTGMYGKIPGNILIGAQGQNIVPKSQMPDSSQLSLIQKAGKRHRTHKHKKSKRRHTRRHYRR